MNGDSRVRGGVTTQPIASGFHSFLQQFSMIMSFLIYFYKDIKNLILKCGKPQMQLFSFGSAFRFHCHSDSGRIPNPLLPGRILIMTFTSFK